MKYSIFKELSKISLPYVAATSNINGSKPQIDIPHLTINGGVKLSRFRLQKHFQKVLQ